MFRPLAWAPAAMLAGLAIPASAHVKAHPDSATAGSYFETAFTVPHGCDGSPTIALRIKIPDEIISVKPQMKPGWTVSIKMRKLHPPRKTEHGRTITESVDEVEWRGGPLPDNLYDSFGLMMKLPDTAGKRVYFPTVQECQQGIHRWVEIPAADGQGWTDLREPVPFVTLAPKSP